MEDIKAASLSTLALSFSSDLLFYKFNRETVILPFAILPVTILPFAILPPLAIHS